MAIVSIVIILGAVFALEAFGIVTTPLSIENGIGVIRGTNTGDPTLLFAESYIETKLQFSDSIKSSRTDSILSTFSPFSLVGATDTTLNPLIRAELFVFTDYSRMGSDVKFDFPRLTIKNFVTVNGIPASNVGIGTIVENNYNKDTKILKGIGIHITPEFFERMILQGTTLQSGDIIEVIMTVEGRYDVQKVDTGRLYDGWINGLNTSIVFRYYEPVDLLLLRAGTTENFVEELHLSGCVDANVNGICDKNDSTVVQETTVDTNTGSIETTTTVSTPPIGQTNCVECFSEPIFGDIVPEEPIELPNGEQSTIYTSESSVQGSGGVTVAVDETALEEGSTSEDVVDTILSTIQDKREGDENAILGFIVMGVAVAGFVIYLVIRKVRNK